MGGEDSKLILMNGDESDASKLSDFELNTICAAGTGSFLDQQANRIGVSIETEFGEMALKSTNPPSRNSWLNSRKKIWICIWNI